jgi:hypothetical protein
MEWLLTVAGSTSSTDVAGALADHGVTVRTELDPVPQLDGTKILFAVGPAGLDRLVADGLVPGVLNAHPSSPQTPF